MRSIWQIPDANHMVIGPEPDEKRIENICVILGTENIYYTQPNDELAREFGEVMPKRVFTIGADITEHVTERFPDDVDITELPS